MPRPTILVRFVFLVLLTSALLLPTAKGEELVLGIGPPPPPPLVSPVGESVTFFGSIANNSNFTLNSGNVSFEFFETSAGARIASLEFSEISAGARIALYDGALFFDEALPENFFLAPGERTRTLIPLFTVTLARNAIPGQTYFFGVRLLGPGGTMSNIVNTSITATAAVPEPATLLLLGTGLAGVVAARRRSKHGERGFRVLVFRSGGTP